jgi:hypothetical protein
LPLANRRLNLLPALARSGLCCSEVDMAQIAHELDAAENALMASGGMDNPEYLQ